MEKGGKYENGRVIFCVPSHLSFMFEANRDLQ